MFDKHKIKQDLYDILGKPKKNEFHDEPPWPWALVILIAYLLTTQWIISYLLFK